LRRYVHMTGSLLFPELHIYAGMDTRVRNIFPVKPGTLSYRKTVPEKKIKIALVYFLDRLDFT
jgi:hypothetical protein